MKPKEFLDNFGVLADAPGGVKKLRDLVLELAVTGRLFPRKAGTRDDPVADANFGDLPILPTGWRWAPLDEVLALLRNGASTSPREGGGVRVLRISAVRPNRVNIDDVKSLPGSIEDYQSFIVEEGDLLFTRYSGNAEFVGACGVVPKVPAPTVHPDKLIRGVARREVAEPTFLALAVNAGASRSYIDTCTKTTAGQVGISGKQLKGTPVPIPPLAEQKRIVAKVDQLMALLDDLEAKQVKRQHTVVRANQACLDALTTAETPEDVMAAWKRVAGHWQVLSDRPEAVGELRRATFTLACKGALTHRVQHASDGQSVLVQIAQERRRWMERQTGETASEAARHERKLEEQGVPDASGVVPPNWAWATLLRACWRMVDCHNKTAPYTDSGVRLVRTSNIRDGRVLLEASRYVSEKTYAYWSRRCPPAPGDVLFTREAPMGECGLVPPGARLCMGQRMMLLRTFPDLLDPRYLIIAIRDPLFQGRMVASAIGSTVKHLRVGDVESLVIPVPPVEEQKLIVAKVDQLMAMCDALEAALRSRDDRAGRLVAAMVGEVTG